MVRTTFLPNGRSYRSLAVLLSAFIFIKKLVFVNSDEERMNMYL